MGDFFVLTVFVLQIFMYAGTVQIQVFAGEGQIGLITSVTHQYHLKLMYIQNALSLKQRKSQKDTLLV